jgi:acetyltransferase-like isoleucine patch superfamily enzyme
MWTSLERARRVFARDLEQGLSPRELASKTTRYLRELAVTSLYLHGVTRVGAGVRCAGRPRIDNRGRMVIGDHTLLRSATAPVELATGRGASLELGADCSLNSGVSIGALERVSVGARCRLGPYVMVVDSDFHDVYERARRPPPRPVVIGDDVWLGAKASVLPGVTIGRGAIVGTSAVVTHDVEPFTVVAGVPAKLLRHLDPARFVVSR